jgi:hypothetical protein
VFTKLRKNGSHAQTAAHQHHGAVPLADVAGQPQGADEIEQVIALRQAQHLEGGLAHRLNDHRDRAARGIEIGDREGNALAVLVDARHDEMSWAGGASHVRRAYFPKKRGGAKLLSADNGIHPPI